MSWQIQTSKALSVTADLSAITGDFAIAFWLKRGSGISSRWSLLDATPNVYVRSLPVLSGTSQDALVRNASGVLSNWAGTGDGTIANDTWELVIVEHDSGTNLRSYNGATGGTADGFTSGWAGTSTMDIRIGRDSEDTYSGAYKIAHFAIYKSLLSGASKTALAGGANPTAIDEAASHLLFYLYDDYEDTYVGGYTMTQIGAGSTITWDSGDDPTVDAPGGGQSPVPIFMSHYN